MADLDPAKLSDTLIRLLSRGGPDRLDRDADGWVAVETACVAVSRELSAAVAEQQLLKLHIGRLEISGTRIRMSSRRANSGAWSPDILFHATVNRLQVRPFLFDPREEVFVHLGIIRNVTERPRRDLGKPALDGGVGEDRELQARITLVINSLLKNAEKRLGNVGAGRADSHDELAGSNTTDNRNAFLSPATVIIKCDHNLAHFAVAKFDTTTGVDLVGSGTHHAFSVDAKRAHDARFCTEACNVDFTVKFLCQSSSTDARQRNSGGTCKQVEAFHYHFLPQGAPLWVAILMSGKSCF